MRNEERDRKKNKMKEKNLVYVKYFLGGMKHVSLCIPTHTIEAQYPIGTSMSTLATIENAQVYIPTQTSTTLPIERAPNPTKPTIVLIRSHIHTTVPTTQTPWWKFSLVAHPWPTPAPWSSFFHKIPHPWWHWWWETGSIFLVHCVWCCWFSLNWEQNQHKKWYECQSLCHYCIHLECVCSVAKGLGF